jgi:caffeoyl-CoA O-methyltransferase
MTRARSLPLAGLLSLALLASGCGSPPAPGAGSSATPTASNPAPEARGPRTEPTPDVTKLLDDIRAADTGQLAVSEADGRFLRTLVVATGARRALEIGGASGYSAIWLGLGLRETGGTLVTIEYDPGRATELKANIDAAGLSDVVTVVAGDAKQEIPKVEGTFDLVFIDAWKPDYQRYFELTFPRVEQGGLILAHNVINKGSEMPEFLETIRTHPDVLTSIISAGTEGISLTVKR